jgi:hypothetical protein
MRSAIMRSGVRLSLSFFFILLFCSMTLAQGAKVSPDNPAQSQRDRPEERARWFLRGRTVDGRPAAEQLHRAYNQKLNHRRLQAQPPAQSGAQDATPSASPRPLFVPQPAGGPVWTPLGPAPTATAAVGSSQQDYGPAVGRVTAVVVDQTDISGNTVYIGGASGGVWKTTNAVSATRACTSGGVCAAPVVWTPLTDGQATLTVGSIALQPGNSNLILVGTGEANNSADSYYGLGILRSTDGGATWNLIPQTANGAFKFHGLGFTHIAFATDNPGGACPAAPGTLSTCTVVATAAGASAGISLGAETGGVAARGLHYSTDAGLNWSRASVSDGATSPDPGSANAVIYNPFTHTFYANLRYHGFYSSADGANWTRLPNQPPPVTAACTSTTNSTCPLYRAEMALVPGRTGANNGGEMYVWIYDSTEDNRGIFQTTDGGQTWNTISTTGIDACGDSIGCGSGSTGQGTYNITLAAIPNGSTVTDLYAGGVNQYKCSINPITNPSCSSPGFRNLTHVYGCSPTGNIAHVHPDEHGIDFLGNDATGAFFAAHPSSDPPVFFGNDGGVYRVLHNTSLTDGTCPSGTPASLFDNLNPMMGSMIQFVGFSHHPTDSITLLGGTQDNGSPAVSSASPSSGAWLSVNNGDGGFNDINPLSPNEWFTSNPDLSFGGGIQRCTGGISCTYQSFFPVVTQDKIGGDESSFYTFFILDPLASGRMLVGSCRVWRGNSDGSSPDWSVGSVGGNPLTFNLNTQVAASCAPGAFMVNTIAAGGPCNGPCNPGITPQSGTGGGSQVVWAGLEGSSDTSSGGQVWRTLSADFGPSSWSEVSGLNSGTTAPCTSTPSACNINPGHYTTSGIALDPNNSNIVYVTVMGFGVGHVFKTTDAGATWAKLDGDPSSTGLPDAPADAVIADPNVANLVYVGTDVGVFKSTGDGVWTELGPASGPGSLPNVAITQLKIYNNPSDPNPLRLRASTYGRGIWEISISPTPGYTMAIANSPLYAFAGQTADFSGAITTFNNYNNSINVTCTAGSTAPPSTCNPVTIPAPATSGSFTVAAGNSAVGDFNFNLTALGSDIKAVTFQSPVALHSVDFSVGAIPAATAAASNNASVNFNVAALGQFTGSVTLTCSGLPAGAGPCSFSPNPASLVPGATASVALDVPTLASTTPGTYTVTITGTGTLGAATKPHSSTMTLTVISAALAFDVTPTTPTALGTVKPGQPLSGAVTISSPGSFAGTLALTCPFHAGTGDPGASTCSINPSSVTLAAGQSAPSTFTISTSGALPTNPQIDVTATEAANHATKSVAFSYKVVDYSLAVSTPSPTVPGSSSSVNVTVFAQNGFTSSIGANCIPQSPLTCVLNPVGPYTLTSSTASISATATISAPANTTAGVYSVALSSSDNAFPSLTHNRTISLGVQNFQLTGTPTTETVRAGGTPAPHVINITGQGGFNGTVSFDPAGGGGCTGLPALTTCTFSLPSVSAGGATTLTIQTTAPSVALVSPSGRHTAPLLYAFWITLPGMVIGLFGIAASPSNRRGKLASYASLGLLLALLVALTACGGGGGSSSTTPPPIPKPGTPAGTYNITVTGTSRVGNSTLTNSVPITLTVQ